jgi:hypothetical protein
MQLFIVVILVLGKHGFVHYGAPCHGGVESVEVHYKLVQRQDTSHYR